MSCTQTIDCAACGAPCPADQEACLACQVQAEINRLDLEEFLFDAVKTLGAQYADLGRRHAELQLELIAVRSELLNYKNKPQGDPK